MDTIIHLDIGGTVFTYHYLASGSTATASQISQASVTVHEPSGSQLIPNQAVEPAPDGKMCIEIPAEKAARVGDYYRARFQYSVESVAHVKDIYFHLSRTLFDLPVHYDDLLRLEPDLASMPFTGDQKFEQFRLAARDELFYRLKAAGRRPWRILNLDDLKPCPLYLWAS